MADRQICHAWLAGAVVANIVTGGPPAALLCGGRCKHMRTEPRTVPISEWPPLPLDGVFPETLCTVEVAQLLRYDAEGMGVERAKQNVRWLVRNRDLPVMAKIGQRYLYRKAAVLAWATGQFQQEDRATT